MDEGRRSGGITRRRSLAYGPALALTGASAGAQPSGSTASTAPAALSASAESFIPKRTLGLLWPLSVIDSMPFEFYRIVPDGVLLIGAAVGLQEFSSRDVDRVMADSEKVAEAVAARGIDIIVQTGVPLPLVMGVDSHDRLLQRLSKATGKPATSSVLAVAKACRQMGLKTVALANKWRPDMNATLGQFLAREGVGVAGVAADVMEPSRFQKIGIRESLEMALRLGEQALREFPDADGLYIGGGSWMVVPIVDELERRFGKPVICNQAALIWHTLKAVDYWKPVKGCGRLLSVA